MATPTLTAAVPSGSFRPRALVETRSRGMAINLAALKLRIKATSNVAKLTGVMKLVASSKLRAVESRLTESKPFGVSLLKSICPPQDQSNAESSKNILFLVMTTDRGLCGGVNSTICREVRSDLKELVDAGHNVKLFVCGEKGRAQLTRDYADRMVVAIDSCFDKDPIFPVAASIAEEVVRQPFDELHMFYNEFENAAKFNSTKKIIPQAAGYPVGKLPPHMKGWEVEPENNEEVLVNTQEYALAGSILYAMMESQACEVSQRIISMDNASTNASDMVGRFTLQYNRGRQAKITTELTEIISGAESLVVEGDDD